MTYQNKNHHTPSDAKPKTHKRPKVIRVLIYVGAFLLSVFALLFVALNIFIGWLNTDNGGQWVAMQVNKSLADTGYNAQLEDFGLSGLTGVAADVLTLNQGDTVIARAQDFGISLNPLSFVARRIGFNIDANELRIENLPKSTNEQKQDDKAFVLPDLFFDVAVVDIDIDRFILGDNIVKGGLETSINLEQKIIRDGQSLNASGYASLAGEEGFFSSPYFPGRIETALMFDASTMILDFKNVEFVNKNYDAVASGTFNIKEEVLDVQSKGTWLYPEKLFADIQKPITLNFSVSGKIEALTGRAEIETKYKGQDVTVASDIRYENDVIYLSGIKGRGGLGEIDGAIDYNLETSIAIGTLNYRLEDLAFLDMFIPDLGLKGAASGDLRLFKNQDTQAVKLSSHVANPEWQDILAQSATLSLSLDDIENTQQYKASLSVSKLQSGGVVLDKAGVDVEPKDGGFDYNFTLSGYNVNPFSAGASGHISNFEPLNVEFTALNITMGTSRFTGAGHIQDQQIDLRIKGEPFNVSELAFVDTSTWPPFRFEIFDAVMNGTLAAPQIKAEYRLRPRIKKDGVTAVLRGQTSYQNGQIETSLSGEGTGIRKLDARLSLPMTLSLQPFAFEFSETSPLNGTVDSEADIGALTTIFMDQGYTFDGMLDANAAISGSINAPSLNGKLHFIDGRFIDGYNDIHILDIDLNAVFENRRVSIANFTATDREGTGTLNGQGFMDLDALDNPRMDLSMTADNMHMVQSKNFDAWLNADMALKGSNGAYNLTGEIHPEEINFTIPDQFYESIPELNVIKRDEKKGALEEFYDSVRLDLTFSAENKIFIMGRGLDAEAAGKLAITGDLNSPMIDGTLATIRGRYEEFGRVFTLEKAQLVFRGAIPPSPYLDVVAATKVDDRTAKVLISDSFENPSVKLTAVPAMPEDEVLSLILFGRNMQEISPFQAVQLADTLRRFSGHGGSGINPIQKLRQATGLDDLHVEGVGSDSTSVGAGKHLSDKVYVEVEQGSGESAGGAASVEVEITPDITLESKAAQNGESDIGVFWEWDY